MGYAASWQPTTAKLHSGCVRVSASQTTCCRHQLPLTGGRLALPGYSCRSYSTGQERPHDAWQPSCNLKALIRPFPPSSPSFLNAANDLVKSVRLSHVFLKS